MVKRIDEDQKSRPASLPLIAEYTAMPQERLARGCSAMHRTIDHLGRAINGAIRALAGQAQALSGQVPVIDDGGSACPLSEEDLERKDMQHAMAAQLGLFALQNLVSEVNDVVVVTGGDMLMEARLPEGLAQTCDELGHASISQIVEMLAASKPEQARELSEILAGDPSSKN